MEERKEFLRRAKALSARWDLVKFHDDFTFEIELCGGVFTHKITVKRTYAIDDVHVYIPPSFHPDYGTDPGDSHTKRKRLTWRQCLDLLDEVESEIRLDELGEEIESE
jgi:hypothetical protein